MYIKNAIILVLLFIPLLSNAQIKIDDVGDGWKSKVDSAIKLIKSIDTVKYNLLKESCSNVRFWTGGFSTTEDSCILISAKEAKYGSVNDIAACLVHESLHLYIQRNHISMNPLDEEQLCYLYELDFLFQIKNVEPWLLQHALEHSKD